MDSNEREKQPRRRSDRHKNKENIPNDFNKGRSRVSRRVERQYKQFQLEKDKWKDLLGRAKNIFSRDKVVIENEVEKRTGHKRRSAKDEHKSFRLSIKQVILSLGTV